MKKSSALTLVVASLYITACNSSSADQPFPSLPAATFKATFDGTEKTFEIANAYSNVNNGIYEITIIGEKKITQDSSVTVKFTIPDFTKTNSTTFSKSLGGPSVFQNVFVESKTSQGGSQAWIHPYQSGKLDVMFHDKDFLDGTFNFVYFLFDKYVNKVGEVNVTQGHFTNVKIIRQ
jgi:hypothetical protein